MTTVVKVQLPQENDEIYVWLKDNELESIHSNLRKQIGANLSLTQLQLIDDSDLGELCAVLELNLQQKIKFKGCIRESKIKILNSTSHNCNNNNVNQNNNDTNDCKSDAASSTAPAWIDQFNYGIGALGVMSQAKTSMSLKSCKYKIKLILLGKERVGKTSIVQKFAYNRFDPRTPSSVAVDTLCTVVYTTKNIPVFVEVWDTAGQEKYDSYTKQYFRNSNCAIIVYDIADRDSFNCIENRFISSIEQQYPSGGIFVIIVGNKTDLSRARQVSKEEGEKMATKYGYGFCEVSAKNGSHIYALFRACAERSKGQANFQQLQVHDIAIKNQKESKVVKSNTKCCN